MPNTPRSQLSPYGVATLIVLVALLLMLLVDRWVSMSQTPFLMFVGAIVVSAWYGGWKPGLYATGLVMLVVCYFFLPPYHQLALDRGNAVRLMLFALQGVLISSVCEAMRTAKRRAEISLRRLRESEERFRLALSSSDITVFQQDRSLRYQWTYNPLGLQSAEDLIGKTDYDLYSTKDANQLTAIKQQVLRNGLSSRSEIEMTLAGKPQYYDLIIEPIYGIGAKVDGITCAAVNITERRQTEQELQSVNQQVSNILESITDSFFAVDREWRFTYVNRRFEELVERSRDQLLGQGIWDLFPDAIGNEFYQQYHQAIAEQTVLTIEAFSIETPDRWFTARAYPSLDGLAVYLQETTDFRRVQQTLRESEQRFRAMFNQAAVGIAQVGLDGRFIEVNPALCAITGYSDAELNQMTLQQITHPDDLQMDWERMRQVLDREVDSYSLEKRYIRSDGSTTWVNLTSSVVWDETGTPKYAVGIIEDISDRKRFEAAQAFLVEVSTMLAASLDYEGALTGVAQLAVPEHADWCIVDIIKDGSIIQQLAIVCADADKQQILTTMRQLYPPSSRKNHPLITELQQGRSIFYPEFPLELLTQMAQNANHLQMLQRLEIGSLIVVPLRSRGQIFGSLSFAMAESKRKYSTSDFSFIEDIARRAAIAIDNARLYQEAERANRIKDEFLAVLSHELRTPLNPVLGWAKLLRTGKYDETTKERALETIERNAKLQAQLIEDLLDVSRILRGKMNLNVSAVNLVGVIEAALETVHLSAAAKSIRLQFTPLAPDSQARSAFLVSGDPGRLQQIVWNLLSNAIKFTPAGGQVDVILEQIEITNAAPRLEAASELRSRPHARITISDTGKGVSSEFLPFVFDYFRQADGTTTRKFGGLGLGLAIVRHLTELHGGTVAAESAGENQGATFTVTLPIASSSDQTISPPSKSLNSKNLAGLAGKRILVVDDEPDMRELISVILQQHKMQVTPVSAASEALHTLAQFLPDLLICDIGMPEVDGYMLIRQIRSLPADRGKIPAIALTAYAGEANQQRAIAAGFQLHIAKPVESEELIAAIAKLLIEKS